jgi:DNA-directed RNA polymerase specialized sigma24 family protein
MSNNEPDETGREPQSPTPGQSEALQRAARAAKDLKPLEMVDALHQSFLLDGLTNRLRRNWSSFSLHDAEDVVSESVDVLYQTVHAGKPVGSISSFLNKVAHRKACDLWSKRRHVTSFPPGSPELETPCDDASVANRTKAPAKGDEMPDREEAVKQSIAIARHLLPQLGQENIRLTPTQALARCAELRLLNGNPGHERSAQDALLQTAEVLSPFLESTAPGAVTIELPPEITFSEAELFQKCISPLAALGVEVRLGVAATPELALLSARLANPIRMVEFSASFLAPLPIEALQPSDELSSVLPVGEAATKLLRQTTIPASCSWGNATGSP